MTTREVCRLVRLAAVALAPTIAFAQDVQPPPQRPQIGPAIQKIATASALSTEPMGAITSVRELSDGRILVNDILRRRLLLMDTTLHTVKVVLDSLSELSNAYGVRGGAIIGLQGDTTLFIDPASYAMVVLDGDGKIVRVRSVWRVEHVFNITNSGSVFGVPGLDAKGRIVYLVQAQPAPPKVAPPPGVPWFPEQPDSAFIVGVTLETRKLDTLGVVRIPKSEMRIRQTADNRIMFEEVRNPLPATDDWAVMPNGTVAFVRGRDYRIEYLKEDGKITSSEKLPYEWQRMTDEDKQHMVDSMKTVLRRQSLNNFAAQMIRWVNMYGKAYPAAFTVPEGFNPPPGMPKDWILPKGVSFPANYMYACPPGVEPTITMGGPMQMMAPGMVVVGRDGAGAVGSVDVVKMGERGPPPTTGAPVTAGAPGATATKASTNAPCAPAPIVFSGGQAPPPPVISPINVVDPLNLPDYKPPFTQGSVRADADGNLWIRTVQPRPVPGGPVFDIVSPEGELVNRLQIPPGYAIVGFGKGKVVYMSMRDAQGIHLARIRLK